MPTNKLTKTQELVLNAMKNGRGLYSYRDDIGEFGCHWVSISTIRALHNKGYIVAEHEIQNGARFETHYNIKQTVA